MSTIVSKEPEAHEEGIDPKSWLAEVHKLLRDLMAKYEEHANSSETRAEIREEIISIIKKPYIGISLDDDVIWQIFLKPLSNDEE